jgi:poly(hydroxyalkanoate) depolymerase family esterase
LKRAALATLSLASACLAGAFGCVSTKSTETIVSGTMTKVMPMTMRGTYRSPEGSREYLAYRPATFPVARAERSLVVMMHGCTQTADDFAKGTRMNSVADSGAFLVLYPEQSVGAHPQKCWNWYTPHDITRGQGEVALLAGMIDSVAKTEGISAAHVSLVGMSAGAAMAANLFVAYPERFGALALHSGVPALAASDGASALAAMHEGSTDGNTLGARAVKAMGARRRPIPVVILQGDSDKVVVPSNLRETVRQFGVINGDAPGLSGLIETHVFPGIGHAWSGGSADGTFTAPQGPNASLIIAAFFREVKTIQ